jgi:AcrR family transcriptional regulator
MARTHARLPGPQRRSTILEAATHAFAAHGYHAASIREIARAAGVTKPVVYDHFGSKQQLYVAVIEGVRDELIARTAAVMAQAMPVEVRIRTAIDGFFRYVDARPAAAKVLFAPPEGDPEIVEVARRVQNEASARLAALFAAEQELVPDVADRGLRVAVAMEFLKMGMHGLAIWWAEHPEVTRTTLVDAVMAIAWAGLRSQFRAQSN